MIELRLLGAVDFRAGGEPDPSQLVAHQKRLALLVYLVAARPYGLHRRDSLVALLWPEVDHEHARASLRKALHGLRHVIGAQAIASNGDEALGIAESRVWCDVRAFDEAVRTGHSMKALALYRGDFLPGFYLSDAPEFEQWVERERTELRGSAISAAWRVAEEASRAGNTADCIAWSRRALQLAPDDEPGARRLIARLDRAGDRAGAIRAYQQFERYLASELGVGPSPETASLIAEVCAKAASRPAPAVNTGHAAAGNVADLDSSGGDRDPMRSHGTLPAAPASELTLERLGDAPAPHAHWRIRAAAVLVLATALTVLSAVTASRHASRPSTSLDNTRVAVTPLENETGRADLDFVGLEVQDWLSRGLQETGLVRVYATGSGLGATRTNAQNGASRDDDRIWAAGLGAGILVRGRYYLRTDSILMEVSIVDVGGGGALATLAPVIGSVRDPTGAIDVLRRRTIAVLATHVDPALKQWASAASQPPSFDAYREFSEGQQATNRDDYDAAIAHFVRAAALDSGYVYPVLMAVSLEMAVRSADSAAALLQTVRQRHLRLAPFDEALADALEARLSHDLERAFDAFQRLRRYVTPGSDWELEAAAMAIALSRPRVAMEIVKSVDLHRPPALDHWDVFVPISNAYHLAGENDALLALLRKEAGRWQNAPLVIVNEMQALAALSRTDEADSLWRTLLHNRPREARGLVMWAAWQGARELRAHGSADAARRLAAEALDSLPTPPASSKVGNRHWRTEVLREAGRQRDAWPLAVELAAKRPQEPYFAATIAVLAAQFGDTLRAREIATRLAHWPAVPDPADVLIARARVAAALGDKRFAVALLHEACDHGCMMMEDLHIVLEFDGLRSYPPFRDLLRPRSGL